MRLFRAAAVLALATAAVATTAPAASAVDPICRVVRIGSDDLTHFEVCVHVEPNLSGTTVAPSFYMTCYSYGVGGPPPNPCERQAAVGETGFVPNTTPPMPIIDTSRGYVRVPDGSLGTLYVDGTAQDVPLIGFCIGDEAFCA